MKWNLILIIIVLILIYFLINQNKKTPETIIKRKIDTVKTIDTVFIKINKYIKSKPILDNFKVNQAKEIIELKKDSLKDLINYIIAPVDTLIEIDKAKLNLIYFPIERDLFIDLEFSKIKEKIIIKDSITVYKKENDLNELFIFSGISFLIGLILSIFAF